MSSLFSLPIRRPVATSMVFLAITLLGVIGWHRIPVELLPPLQGDQLYVSFFRPGSEPEVIEHEILIPLESRMTTLPDVEETWGEVRGSSGSLRVKFDADTSIKVRELEMQRIAAELTHTQPQGTVINVSARDLSDISRFALLVNITGGEDRNALFDLVEELIQPRLSAVPGVSQVIAIGGASREVTVRVDPDRCAANGITSAEVISAMSRSVQRLRFLGGSEDGSIRTSVVLDGRPAGVHSLAELRIVPTRPVLLRHVAEVSAGAGREQMLFRVNGRPSVGLVIFQEEGANLVRLGQQLRHRIDRLREEMSPYGIGILLGFDAAELVEEQLDRLITLGFGGFVIALAVLFLFLRELRAVAVVAIAVPVSLLAALALLYIGGQSLNLMTLFGLAVGIGMLVDNSIVVYEAVQRQLERGVAPDRAAAEGIRRTVRAISAASATTAIVFLPVTFATEEAMTRGMLEVMAIALLLPLGASLVVAVGLVPLLARHLAAPAAMARFAERQEQRTAFAGLVRPDRPRELFSGVLKVALRRPAGWLSGVAGAVLFTVVVAIPWIVVGTATQEPAEADEVRVSIQVEAGGSLEATGEAFSLIEQRVLALVGVERVETMFQEDGGSLTVRLVDKSERPPDLSAGRIRTVIHSAADEQRGVTVTTTSSGEQGGGGDQRGQGSSSLLGQGPAEVVLSGPDARQLQELADEVKRRLESIAEVATVWTSARSGLEEIRVSPEPAALTEFGVTADQVLPALSMFRREGIELQIGFTQANGREIPLVVRSPKKRYRNATTAIEGMRLPAGAGVLPLGVLVQARKMPPPATIQHHNGRREMSVFYTLGTGAPKTGNARRALDEQIRAAVREVHRPAGTAVEALGEEEATSWFKRVLVPVILLLAGVLAITFESLTMPVLVLVALPLTVLGATWALVLAGMPADLMALVGAVALIGLTVNPAILLVDRMQQQVLYGGKTAGAAALAAVRERARPVLMTTCTTIAGLWPLALETGRENEIWPPFATVVMGGLATSTLLTLLVIPVGFVLLGKLDRVFGRLGPWVVMGWLGTTTAVMAPLILTHQISSMKWQITTSVLVAGLLLGAAVLLLSKREPPSPEMRDGPPSVAVRFLCKVYGQPGPIGRALRIGNDFAERVLHRGGDPFIPREAWERMQCHVVLLLGALYLGLNLQTTWWRLVFSFVAAALLGRALLQLRRARGQRDARGVVNPGGIEGLLAVLAPWFVILYLGSRFYLLPRLAEERVQLQPLVLVCLVVAVAVTQLGRHTAKQLAAGRLPTRLLQGPLYRTRTAWRHFCRWVFAFDLPREQVRALDTVHFEAQRGMVGVLGPNGAGKTTLLRLLTGILSPSLGVITYGGVKIGLLRRFLARWVGYLPQDFGLPDNLTAREYLDYYALLYELGNEEQRHGRVQHLLDEVGLGERADSRIGGFSGGMRQRVAVARTLLRLPPVIIVDEPTVGLDPRERIRFRNLLARLAEGRVVLFSTHVVEDVAVACERVIVMAHGAVVFDGEPSRLATTAQGKVWELYLSPGQDDDLPPEALVVDRVPQPDGSSRTRILCPSKPLEAAKPLSPSLEDGYLLLVGERVSREVA